MGYGLSKIFQSVPQLCKKLVEDEIAKTTTTVIATGVIASSGSVLLPLLGLFAVHAGINYLTRDKKEELLNSLENKIENLRAKLPNKFDKLWQTEVTNLEKLLKIEIKQKKQGKELGEVRDICKNILSDFYDRNTDIDTLLTKCDFSHKQIVTLSQLIENQYDEIKSSLLDLKVEHNARKVEHDEIIETIIEGNADQNDLIRSEFQKVLSKLEAKGQTDSRAKLPVDIVNKEIEERLQSIILSRFISTYDSVQGAITFSKELIDGSLFCGNKEIRCRALAWCARLLAYDKSDDSKRILKIAKSLGTCKEIIIADAFLLSAQGKKQEALISLNKESSPLALSAVIRIKGHDDGKQEAVDWIKSAGINISELNADGKIIALIFGFAIRDWDFALKISKSARECDFKEMFILHHYCALAYLVQSIHKNLRHVVLMQIPVGAANFPLASDPKSIEFRNKAIEHFEEARKGMLLAYNCEIAIFEEEYILWLKLRDYEKATYAKKQLEDKLCDYGTSLFWVSLGSQFGIDIDVDELSREIDRKITLLHGDITIEIAKATWALVLCSHYKEVLRLIDKYYDKLTKYIDKYNLYNVKIRALCLDGRQNDAQRCLDSMSEEILTAEQINSLCEIIHEAKIENPIQFRKEQYLKDKSIEKLNDLVCSLEDEADWQELCPYALDLFEQTQSLRDAERVLKSLNNAGKYNELKIFLDKHCHLIKQSEAIKIFYCYSLFYDGKLLEAYEYLKEIDRNFSNRNYRDIFLDIGLSLGNSSILHDFLNNERSLMESRTPAELLQAAQIGVSIDQRKAKIFLFEAIKKASDDVYVFLGAYDIALHAGWDDKIPEVSDWLNKAVQLSKEDGPVRMVTIDEIYDLIPENNSQNEHTIDLLRKGKIPMYMAGDTFNKSIANMTLFSALENVQKEDPRRKIIIPAFSGVNNPGCIDLNKKVGIDGTALLTLSYLKLLGKAIDNLNNIFIPHSTLRWLIDEKNKISFHQPSRIAKAKKLDNLIISGGIEELVPQTIPDADLAELAGEEIAILISEAKNNPQATDTQRIVILPAPVYRVSSLMKKQVDMSVYSDVLGSCISVIDYLKQKNILTEDEENRARSYFSAHEQPWSKQPVIKDNAVLFLGDLAVSYFQHLGLFKHLISANFRVIISSKRVLETKQLLAYESLSSKAIEVIDRTISTIYSGIKEGKISFGKYIPEEQSKDGIPIRELLDLSSECDIILADDRFVNQYPWLENGEGKKLIFSSLDLIDKLANENRITHKERFEYRTLLRKSGYQFLPLNNKEIAYYINSSSIKEEELVETENLKLLRESILLAKMGQYLQLPQEAYWLVSLQNVIVDELKRQWNANIDISIIKANSNWLAELLEVRGWSYSHLDDQNKNYMALYGSFILRLTEILDYSMSKEKIRELWKWLENNFIEDIKNQEPDLYSWLIKMIMDIIDYGVKNYQEEQYKIDKLSINELAKFILLRYPPMIRESVLDNSDYKKKYNVKTDSMLCFSNSNIFFQRSMLFRAVRERLSSGKKTELKDSNGNIWQLQVEPGKKISQFYAVKDNNHIPLPDFSVFSSDTAIRLKCLKTRASEVNLPYDSIKRWEDILSKRPMNDDEFYSFIEDFKNTPTVCADRIFEEISENEGITVSTLVPDSQIYYERLVGKYDGSKSIKEYASGQGNKLFEELSKWNPYEGFLLSLCLSSHNYLTQEINVETLDKEKLIKSFEIIENSGDKLSQVGAIEVGIRILVERPEIESVVMRLIEQIRNDDIKGKNSGFKLMSALFILVYGEMSRIKLFANEPLFYRRLAALAHVSLLQRQIIKSNGDINHFCEWAIEKRSQLFYLQSLLDLRTGPRWNPSYVTELQLKAEAIGRIINYTHLYKEHINNESLINIVLGADPDSLIASIPAFYPFLPGPIEENIDIQSRAPEELITSIKKQLGHKKISAESFTALINTVLFYKLDDELISLAADALKLANYRLANIHDKNEILLVLTGLSSVASLTRNKRLANEIMLLLRKYRKNVEYSITAAESLSIGLYAASAYQDTEEWLKFVGDFMTELALSDLSKEECDHILSSVHWLCHIEPKLWATCGVAEAALKAYKDFRTN